MASESHAQKQKPEFGSANRLLVAAYALSGDIERAGAQLNVVKRLDPDLTIASLTRRVKQIFKQESDFERYIEGMRLAGVPETWSGLTRVFRRR